MARLWQGGAELNSATDGVEVSTNSGTVSISSSTVRTGTYAWRVNPTSSTGFYRHNIFTSNQNTNVFFRVYARITTLPGTTIQFLRFSSTGNASVGRIDLTSGGILQLKGANGVQIGSNSSALSTGTWYRIELNLDASSSPGSLDGRIDGTSFASGANSSQGSWARILWGAITPNSTCDIFFDDLAVNDASGSSQTSFPGAGQVVHQRPNAAGDSTQWTPDSGSNYARVNEVTPDDATSFVSESILNKSDLYTVGASGAASGDTINVVMVGGRFANDVADVTTSFQFQIEKTSGGTISKSSAIVPNTATWGTNASADPRTYPIILYKDPDNASWAQSTVDSAQIGVLAGTVGVNKIEVSTIWMSVDYTPGTPPATSVSSTLPMMGV